MSEIVKPYKNSDKTKKEQVAEMFDTISGNYDGLNRVISFGIDISWRQKVLKLVAEQKPNSVLDIATGTGDLAILMAQTSAKKIVGIDISKGMIDVGHKKIKEQNLTKKITFQIADSENLPFQDNSFDAITVAFGIRNFENLEKGLSEIYRVLSPNGIFVVLETSNPIKFPFKQGYFLYSKYILPAIGRLFSKDKVAYQYLSESASKFPFGKAMHNIFAKIGFINIQILPQTFGVATIYHARK